MDAFLLMWSPNHERASGIWNGVARGRQDLWGLTPVVARGRQGLWGLTPVCWDEALGARSSEGRKTPTCETKGGSLPSPTSPLTAPFSGPCLDLLLFLPSLIGRVPEEDTGLYPSSPRMQQRAVLGPVPLTRTSRTQTLRDQEDEIFKL